MPSPPQSLCNLHPCKGHSGPQNLNDYLDSCSKGDPALVPGTDDIAINEDTPTGTLSICKALDASTIAGNEPCQLATESFLAAQTPKGKDPCDSIEQAPKAICHGDILEWRQIELEEWPGNISNDNKSGGWSTFTGAIRCMNTPVTQHVKRNLNECFDIKPFSQSFFESVNQHDSLSTTCQAHIVKPLGDREGLYPIAEIRDSDPIAYSPFIQPSSPSSQASPRSLLTNTAVKATHKPSAPYSLNPLVIRQARPHNFDGSPSSFSSGPRTNEEAQSVEVKLDGLGGAVITFTPLTPSSPSRTAQGLCHTVDCSPHRHFPKTALSFNKRATLHTRIKDIASDQQRYTFCDSSEATISNETPDSPPHAVVHTAQMHGNSLPHARVRSAYRTVNPVPTKSPPNLHLTGLFSPPSASQKSKHFTASEGVLLVENKGSSSSSILLKQSMIKPSPINSLKEIAKSETGSHLDNARLSIHTGIINNARDVPVSYDAFTESPLQTRDREIMHDLSLSPIELCSLGLHNGRTMTPRARAISALQKLRHHPSRKIDTSIHC
ncbi:hypothetical protein GL50803_0016713 [Giardia duodenalis]|uniref:Uncharacterized protein n=1 Tax=Giardia intestinalis (strain ATCC 50803 / WB clone C6) TaxID=184922 RepID=D3KH29_GIAIC|nr:hypothetical protein GL50803_0016713 [Giardia intestinalis]KAE8305814.1 hypothetical protein GL50803_0016713 [Giardia intestinalis]